jgi:hypothetical protein
MGTGTNDHYSNASKTRYAKEEIDAIERFLRVFREKHTEDAGIENTVREAYETCWKLLKYIPMLYLNKYGIDAPLSKFADQLLKHEMCRAEKVHNDKRMAS